MEHVLNPELIKAVQDHFGLITLAMLLLVPAAILLLPKHPWQVRAVAFCGLLLIYVGVIIVSLQSVDSAADSSDPAPSSEKEKLCDPSEMTPTEFDECTKNQ